MLFSDISALELSGTDMLEASAGAAFGASAGAAFWAYFLGGILCRYDRDLIILEIIRNVQTIL